MREGGSEVTATNTGGSGFRIIKHSSFFHSKSCLDGALEGETCQATGDAYSSHLNDHRKETFPTSLSSTMIDGLKSSRVFCRFTGLGAVPVINNDPDSGSVKARDKNNPAALMGHGLKGLTVDVDLIRCALNPMLAVVHGS